MGPHDAEALARTHRDPGCSSRMMREGAGIISVVRDISPNLPLSASTRVPVRAALPLR